MNLEKFGVYIRELRKKYNFTQQDLAAKTGLTKISICNLEKGKHKPQSKTIASLSKALDCDYDVLIELLK